MKQVQIRTQRTCVFCGKNIARGQNAYMHNNKIYQHIECQTLEITYIGQIGILERDAEGIPRCHICGWYMPFLGKHLTRHEWTADEYREAFGLNRQEPLCSPYYSSLRAKVGKENQDNGKFPSGKKGRETLPHPQRKLYPRVARAQERLTRRELLLKNTHAQKKEA